MLREPAAARGGERAARGPRERRPDGEAATRESGGRRAVAQVPRSHQRDDRHQERQVRLSTNQKHVEKIILIYIYINCPFTTCSMFFIDFFLISNPKNECTW